MKSVIRLCQVTLAILATAVLLACAAPPASSKPAGAAPAVSSAPKIIQIVGISEWKPLQQGTLNCALDVDDDNNTLTYSWSSEQGTITGQGKEVTWTAPDSPGNYKVTVAVSNARGEGTTFSRTFKVTTNPYNNDTPDETIYLKLSLPSTTVVSAAAHPRIWSTSEIQCVVEGMDPSTLTYKWTAPTGKLLANNLADGKADKVGWLAPGVAGDYKVSVTATDRQGDSAGGEVNFNVYCCHP